MEVAGRLVRVIGTDPGTRNFDLCGLEDGRVFLDESIPTVEVARRPEAVVNLIRSAGMVDLIVGPSGYGVPLTDLQDLDAAKVFQTVLVKPEEQDKVSVLLGMRKLFSLLKPMRPPMYFIPGVIHLPTVPESRKVNRIDMGTADKLCSTVLGIYDQARRLGIPYDETSLILLEVGYGYSAAMAVKEGHIVDGVGGTGLIAPLGFVSLGAMDGELAYLLGDFSKTLLFRGGVASIAGREGITPEEFMTLLDEDERCRLAWEAFEESLTKTVAALTISVESPREILLSGRLSRVEQVLERLKPRLSRFGPVRRVEGLGAKKAKEAAQGSAIIADGLAGGRLKALVARVGLREAQGTVLDHIYLAEIGAVKQAFGII